MQKWFGVRNGRAMTAKGGFTKSPDKAEGFARKSDLMAAMPATATAVKGTVTKKDGTKIPGVSEISDIE